MAFTSNTRTIPGLLAGADLSAAQYKVVKFASTAGEVVLAASSVITNGFVLDNDPADGEPASVVYSGIAKAIAGTSTITAGSKLGVDTTSRVVNTTTDNRFVIGVATEAASAVGDLISIIVLDGGQRY